MGSSEHFPSGLNKWLDSDKPMREDFISDNRLLDENAMWKDGYDEDGMIAEAGGIDAYIKGLGSMLEKDYDEDGAVKAAGGIAAYITGNFVLNRIYPVGSVFLGFVETNPAQLLGVGVWERAAIGRTLVGVDNGDTDFEQSGMSGGSKAHQLTEAEMPSHSHQPVSSTNGNPLQLFGVYYPIAVTNGDRQSGYTTTGDATIWSKLKNTGGNASHNNMPPYETVYIWKRVE